MEKPSYMSAVLANDVRLEQLFFRLRVCAQTSQHTVSYNNILVVCLNHNPC